MPYTVRPEFVAQCVTELRDKKIHRNFAGYLAVRRCAVREERTEGLQVDFKEFFETFLRVKGAPELKPYLMPFSESAPSAANLWFNRNPAGSYAPSSFRNVSPFKQVIAIDNSRRGGLYSIKDNEVESVFAHLLFKQPIPIIPLAALLYRDYAFDGGEMDTDVLIDSFETEFGFNAFVPGGIFSAEKLFSLDNNILVGDWYDETQ